MSETTERLSSALADRYRIERELGQGGMATVYLAADIKHDRKVAIKVLKPQLAAVLGDERFVQEIKTTAALQHPHILPLYDSGSAAARPGGSTEFLFYVMPYIEGETLRQKLDREGPLSADEALAITTGIAGALDFAHKQGIIHRDIKPENVLFQDGVALVADFGIAVAVSSAGGERLTETGLSLGTPMYMSPEQVAGEREIDARSDVYALACVTYEMLAGDPPFVASSARAIMAKHVKDPAPPIATARPEVGAAVAKALAKALSKAPADRYASAGAFAAGLAAEERRDDQDVKSLVVLPFANQSPDPDNEYFADGLTEEIITDLSRLRGLRVISRNSAMTLKGTKKDTPTIARELHVSHVLTGSVRRAGTALRVTAELVEAASDTPIWVEKYAGGVQDVFGIQEEIARKIVSALEVTLSASEESQIGERPIDDPVAFECYVRARQEMYDWTVEATRRAHRLVDDALAIVGERPVLLATKAQIHWNEVNTNQVEADAGLPLASDLANRALALAPDFPLAIFVRGLVAGSRGRPEQALPDLYRAHELWPGDANVLTELCRFSNAAGLRNHGVLVDQCMEIDPLTPVTPLVVSTYGTVMGRHAEAATAARRAIAMAPAASMLHVIAAWQITEAGAAAEGCELLGRAGASLAGTPLGRWALFLKHAREGDADGALAQVDPEFERAMQRNEFSAHAVAQGYALLGLADDALRWLRVAIDGGFINYPYTTAHDPFVAGLRGDPRFQRLMADVRPRWEAVVAWERNR
jgi:eukaryotic-like serine/threonine-protein kinase